MAEGGCGREAGEEGPRAVGPRPPSARDLQLALAELYEDEVKCKASKPDRPHATAFKSPRTPPQRFYSSEHECSGLHIVRPSTGKIVNELFKEAREHGAVPLNEATRASGDDKSKSFTGGGYRLGNSFCKRSEYIYGENQLQDVQILLKLWSNGFSLDDGELRPYSDPTNAQFLESVKRGEIPLELQRLVHRGHVNLDMEDHQDQEYIKPRLRFKAFSGEGQKLGSLTPEIVSTPSSPEEEEKSLLNAVVPIDDSVPTTKIQIRLADGSRLIQRFNSTHRILDVRDFIVQSRPEFAALDFILVTSFPNKELTDESLTLQEADILNTVILQQLK
ncbi:UBX domain-containing protein 2B isoform X2 [Physeter macrocephalus]|uniref:UBX domain-containing protein 2B n=1 Tax=Physeter macrocephalus TaxID=9755 RepID=A0A2Y9T1P4_PHYMC|nr:UBX domain-containing protein 2B isoform X2 [Physeter catodon]|eukprot:XP_023982775.1 UBX domain-containing protein 2B isoform X3 [Physeter catodon]